MMVNPIIKNVSVNINKIPDRQTRLTKIVKIVALFPEGLHLRLGVKSTYYSQHRTMKADVPPEAVLFSAKTGKMARIMENSHRAFLIKRYSQEREREHSIPISSKTARIFIATMRTDKQ